MLMFVNVLMFHTNKFAESIVTSDYIVEFLIPRSLLRRNTIKILKRLSSYTCIYMYFHSEVLYLTKNHGIIDKNKYHRHQNRA